MLHQGQRWRDKGDKKAARRVIALTIMSLRAFGSHAERKEEEATSAVSPDASTEEEHQRKRRFI